MVSLWRDSTTSMIFIIRDCSVAGVFLDILSTNATNITVQGVTVWAARGQDRLFPELGKVDQAPVPGSHGLVWQVNILLESSLPTAMSSCQDSPDSFRTFISSLALMFRDLMGLLRSWLTKIGWVATMLSSEAFLLELN